MAEFPRKLEVVLTPAAYRDLARIWNYNAGAYGVDRADGYIQFLRRRTLAIAEIYPQGRQIPERPEYRYTVIRKGRGHGYVAIHHRVGDAVEIIRYYHTAEDWRNRLHEW